MSRRKFLNIQKMSTELTWNVIFFEFHILHQGCLLFAHVIHLGSTYGFNSLAIFIFQVLFTKCQFNFKRTVRNYRKPFSHHSTRGHGYVVVGDLRSGWVYYGNTPNYCLKHTISRRLLLPATHDTRIRSFSRRRSSFVTRQEIVKHSIV